MRTLGTTLAIVLLAGPTAIGGTVQGVARVGAAPAAGVRLTLFVDSLSYFSEVRSAPDGTYAFTNIPAGTYRLGAALRDKEYQQVDVTVGASPIIRDFTLVPETNPGRWDIVGTTAPEVFDGTDIGILLPDGRTMFCHDTIDPIVFNPLTGTNFLAAGSGLAQGCMNTTLLPNGRVIMVGGQEGDDPGNFRLAVRWVKSYDPASNSWTQHPDLLNPTGRWYPGMVRLNDGSLMAMGGGTRPDATRTATCERLNLSTMTWSYTGSMLNPSEFTPCALLYTGEVLITWSPPQLYNVSTGQFRATGNFAQPNRGWPDHSDHSIVVLSDGRVVAVGLRRGANNYTAMSEVYNPATELWNAGSSPSLVRYQTEVVQLPDGRVLVAGGDTGQTNPPEPSILGIVKRTDLYDPAGAPGGSWRRVADMNWFREYHAVTLLVPDGRVVMTGGTRIKFQYGPTSSDIEGFVPPYLLRGVRPRIAGISTTTPDRGRSISLDIFPQTAITSVVLVSSGATTHWVDTGTQRRLVLPVQQTGGTVTATLPVNPNVLPLGNYMLFAMVDDIPSVARIISVVGGCSADFNGDGDTGTDADIEAFFACLAGSCCNTCGSADYNGDGDVGTDADIEAFFRVLGGGPC